MTASAFLLFVLGWVAAFALGFALGLGRGRAQERADAVLWQGIRDRLDRTPRGAA